MKRKYCLVGHMIFAMSIAGSCCAPFTKPEKFRKMAGKVHSEDVEALARVPSAPWKDPKGMVAVYRLARGAFGAVAKDHIRRNFLLPRMLRDELRLFRDVLLGKWQGFLPEGLAEGHKP